MFTKTGKKDNWVHATRPDGTRLSFPWANHPGLPHDAMHVVVERCFALRRGFWGLFADGVDLMTLNSAVDQARTGIKVKDLAGRDTTELYQAEALVACFSNELLWSGRRSDDERREALAEICASWGVPVPARYDASLAEAVSTELDQLLQHWNQLSAGEALTLTI